VDVLLTGWMPVASWRVGGAIVAPPPKFFSCKNTKFQAGSPLFWEDLGAKLKL